MAALAVACETGLVGASIAIVVVPTSGSPAEVTAREHELETAVLDPKDALFGERLLDLFERYQVSFVCLAGFLRLLPDTVINRFPGRVLNIHPALLPKFGGKGMYGHHVHEAVLAAHETQSGATVHFVSANYDEGVVLLQECCPVLPDDTPDSLARRVLEIEHRIYPLALQQLIESHGCSTNSA